MHTYADAALPAYRECSFRIYEPVPLSTVCGFLAIDGRNFEDGTSARQSYIRSVPEYIRDT